MAEQPAMKLPRFLIQLERINDYIVVKEAWRTEEPMDQPWDNVTYVRAGDSSWSAQVLLSGAFHTLAMWEKQSME